MKKKGLSPRQVFLEDTSENDFWGGLDIGIRLEDFEERRNLLEEFPHIRLSLGLYPSEVELPNLDEKLKVLEKTLRMWSWSQKMGPVVALGECGLDLHWQYGTLKDQQVLFQNQIALSNKYNLPLIVHNRNATAEVLGCFMNNPPTAGGIMHCFSGSPKDAQLFLDYGFYLSFAGNLTFKNNNDLRTTLRYVPRDRLLFETDSPYLSPVPFRGKINRPGYVRYVYQEASKVLGIDTDVLKRVIVINFLRLFPAFGEDEKLRSFLARE
ncbi:MAG: TatD family hydrolase [Spirochaetales bacterium]|nr:TatD family hydrolase [Spirochaetales bacterium]